MAKFRTLKAELRAGLVSEGWRDCLHGLAEGDPKEYIGPLMALLPQGGLLRWRAASGLGLCMAALAESRMEEARIVMRRLMWHMNEESGNLGWGIPESMAEILSRSPALAKEYSRVLLSYVWDSGRDDNFIDHPPLLCGCFWAAGRLAEARPDLAQDLPPRLIFGLGHEDALVRGQAALALLKALRAAPALAGAISAEELRNARLGLENMRKEETAVEDYNGDAIEYFEAGELAARILSLLPASA